MALKPALVGVALLLSTLACSQSSAEDSWNPFRDIDKRADRASRSKPGESPPLPPADPSGRPWAGDNAFGPTAAPSSLSEQPVPWDQSLPRTVGSVPSDSVQRSELQPIAASEATPALQPGLQGLDANQLRDLLASLPLPPSSAALAGLWSRTFAGGELQGTNSPARAASPLTSIRMEALYRTGNLPELAKAVQGVQLDTNNPALGLPLVRTRILLGERDTGCGELKSLQRSQASLPKPERHEFLLLAALCGAGDRDPGAAGLAADLLRSEAVEAPTALAVLDAIAASAVETFKPPSVKRITLLDYRFLELARATRWPGLVPAAEPAVLATMAASDSDTAMRILAGETALSLHIIGPAELAVIYRAAPFSQQSLATPLADRQEPPLKRALLFRAFEAERTPIKKARLARALLDDVRRARGPYMPTAAMLAAALTELRPAPEIGWFAETAIEIALSAGQFDGARPWTEPPLGERYGGLRHWLVLADIADPKWPGRRGEALSTVENFALRGRLSPELMHRLVTVLDALDYQIPIPLWEAASRSPQPSSGHLPDTGVLTQLQNAGRNQEHARLTLLAIRTLGSDSPGSAHIISLGDTIRALKRAGMEADARRLGLEALFADWPRTANN